MKRLIEFVLGALLLSGCASSSPDESKSYGAQDKMFAEMMIPHHEQAIEMAELAFANTTNADILTLAEKIRAAQEPEIDLMKSWPGVDSMGHAGHTMTGMLDENEIKMLRASTGADFDRLFLEGMIKHHDGAIDMAEAVIDSKNPEVANLATAIISAQKAEIEEMKSLQGK